MNQRIIIIFSGLYPFNPRGDFLAREIDALTESFDRVIIVPITSGLLTGVEKPARIELVVKPTQIYRTTLGKVLYLILGIASLPIAIPYILRGRALGAGILRRSSPKQIAHALMVLGYDVAAAWYLSRIIKPGSRALVFYYWLAPVGFLTAAILRWTGRVGRLAGRGHGEDIFSEERQNQQALTRYGFLNLVDDVWTAHDEGGKYLVEKVGVPKEKVRTFRLGVPDLGRIAEPLRKATARSLLLSCSHLLAAEANAGWLVECASCWLNVPRSKRSIGRTSGQGREWTRWKESLPTATPPSFLTGGATFLLQSCWKIWLSYGPMSSSISAC